MERLQQRLNQAALALDKFDEILTLPKNDVQRDAAIQRFEFTTEAVWKLAQLYLRQKHGLEANSPKAVMRLCFEVQLLDEEETSEAIGLIDDRNLTTHTYNEGLADAIYQKLPRYLLLLKKLFQGVGSNE